MLGVLQNATDVVDCFIVVQQNVTVLELPTTRITNLDAIVAVVHVSSYPK
jgi:hypothetical protein